jgi:DNA-binding response OmpR family regulator
MDGIRTMLVGDEDGPASELVDRLRESTATVSVVADGAAALQHLDMLEPGLILIQQPLVGRLEAFETCRVLRSRTDAVLVIVSADPGPHDELVALAVGADLLLLADAPLDVAAARLRALVRRARGEVLIGIESYAAAPSSRSENGNGHVRAVSDTQWGMLPRGGAGTGQLVERIVSGDLEIDLLAHEVTVAGRPVDVTRIEFDLLVALARSPRRVLTREQLIEAVWDAPVDSSHVLDAHLSRLRCKIGQAGGERIAHAVRGIGYRLRD